MLHGKTYWLIGASAGIGEALAKELTARGAKVILSARNAETLQKLVSEIGVDKATTLPLDVLDNAAVKKAASEIICDGMVYLAGTYTPMFSYEMDEAVARQTFEINFVGAFNTIAAELPKMIAKGAGHLVLFSSVAGFRGLPNGLTYGASKAALTNLAETLYLELTPKNIRVQVVHPGFVKTRLTDKNHFEMPFCITTEEAAKATADGMERDSFEIHYPKRFTYFMKWLRILPYPVYFWITKKLLRL